MNLHSIASGAIGAVNPFIPATIRVSDGYTVVNYEQVPAYLDPVEVMLQRQALTQADLRHVENINMQGVMTAAYVKGNYYGIVRDDGKGGDLFEFGGEKWLLVKVIEAWPDWCKVILCQQLST